MDNVVITIFPDGRSNRFHYSMDQTYRPAPFSHGYKNKALATLAGVQAATDEGYHVSYVTGHADKSICKEMGVTFKDPRKGRKSDKTRTWELAAQELWADCGKPMPLGQFTSRLRELRALSER